MQNTPTQKNTRNQNTLNRFKVNCITGSPVKGILSVSKRKQKEKISNQKKQYYILNKEKIKNTRKKYRLKNIEKIREQEKRYKTNLSPEIKKERNRITYQRRLLKYPLKIKINKPKKKKFKSEKTLFKTRIRKLNIDTSFTLEKYKELLSVQKELCAICNKKDKGRVLAIDHCHKTRVVRGLLCQKCNRSLGGFGDNPELVLKAYNYLIKIKYGKK